jgi:hypothetical protein
MIRLQLAGDWRDAANAQHFAPRAQLVMPADARNGFEAGGESRASDRKASESAREPDAGGKTLPRHDLVRRQQRVLLKTRRARTGHEVRDGSGWRHRLDPLRGRRRLEGNGEGEEKQPGADSHARS